MIEREVLEELEFFKVLDFIANYSHTELGKQRIQELRPFENKEQAVKTGLLVSEAKEILIEKDIPPFEFIPNLTEALRKSKIENGVLNKKEIFEILKLAGVSRKLFQFFKTISFKNKIFDEYLKKLFVDKVFERQIERIFTSNGEVKDNASKNLNEIRTSIREKQALLQNVVQKILKDLSANYLVQEEYITQRDGRIVLPVKAEHKRHLKGFIHSESATGKTVYIEPEETLELNNEILSLKFAEKREIERIFRELTKIIASRSDELKQALDLIAFADLLFSIARYSFEIVGAFPTVDNSRPEEIIEARHPLLLKKFGRSKTVPLSIKIEDEKIIVVTGPNAGGKTVAIKNIGILHLCVFAGIHVPVHPDSNFHFYSKVLVDIGDRQSIENDLSTYSSHLSNIKRILEKADAGSLILLDEIGTGTDPSEGAALAAAILFELNKKGSTVLATTHHGSLKIIANNTPGFLNASMEFDMENISPTYRFRQGIPGSSYAFEVAERIGLEKDFLEGAKKFLDKDVRKLEEFLIDLERKSAHLNERLRELEIENSRLKGLSELYKQKLEKLESQKSEIIRKTLMEAEGMLSEMNREFEATVKKIKESNANKKVVREGKEKINALKRNFEKLNYSVKEDNDEKITELAVGDFVGIRNSSTVGEVVLIDRAKKRATITTGSLNIQVKIEDLVRAEKPYSSKSGGAADVAKILSGLPGGRLDIRGRRPDEVEFEIVKFIDDAYIAGLRDVEIIHGKGTGALKNTVRKILKKHENVKNFEFAKIELGGEGVTIVYLK